MFSLISLKISKFWSPNTENFKKTWSQNFSLNSSKVPKVNGHFWPKYSIDSNDFVNATYIVFYPDDNLLGKVYVNAYDGDDGFTPSVINNCFNFWDQIFREQFSTHTQVLVWSTEWGWKKRKKSFVVKQR
jgi:hypothetical protein